jgi:hypothetical protein
MNQKDPQNPPKVEKLQPETVPFKRLGFSTANRPIPEEYKRVHRAVIARAMREQRRAR